jgi:serralysin
MSTQPRRWYCSTIDRRPDDSAGLSLEGVGDRRNRWKRGTVLRVRFLHGEPALQARVLASARQWLVPGVQLDILPAKAGERAQIRIDFEDDGSWSYIGKECLQIHPSQPTMNLGWATMETDQDDFDSVVIHEFGHALALLHEHNHPKAKIQWNKPAVDADLSGDPNYWDQATIDANVYAAFDASEVIVTEFDKASVMIYPVLPSWTLDGSSFTPSPRLSKGDAQTILKLYGAP